MKQKSQWVHLFIYWNSTIDDSKGYWKKLSKSPFIFHWSIYVEKFVWNLDLSLNIRLLKVHQKRSACRWERRFGIQYLKTSRCYQNYQTIGKREHWSSLIFIDPYWSSFNIDPYWSASKNLQSICHKFLKSIKAEFAITTAQKWSFPVRVFSIYVTKFSGNCEFGHIY